MKLSPHFCFASTLIFVGLVFTGCKPKSTSADAKTQWVKPAKLQPGPIRHERLTEEQMTRVHRLQNVFSQVDPSPLEKWVDDFRRDANPESELRIWESMSTAYEAFTASHNLSLDAKKEAYRIVLLRSGATEDEVLKHLKLKILTEKDAREIMALYTSRPESIKVVSP